MSDRLLLYITDAEGLGGAEGYLETLLRNVDRDLYHVALALPPRDATAPLVATAQQLGVTVYPLDVVHRDGINPTALWRSIQLVRTLRPQVIHAVLNGPRRCAETLLAAALLRVPRRIATFQLVTPIPHFRGLIGVLRRLNRTAQFRLLHCGIAVSQSNARLLVEQYGFPAHQLTVIPNGIDVSMFGPQPPSGEFRMAWGIAAETPLIGVVGRLGSQKGQDVLINALALVREHHPDAQLVLIGAGPTEAALRELVACLGLTEAVHFAGQIDHDDLPAALAELDVFALPSHYEGLPFAVVEAMAAGKPIVASAVDGTNEALADGWSGLLVPPGDAKALAAALVRVLKDASLRSWLGQAARADSSRFDQIAMLRSTFKLYWPN